MAVRAVYDSLDFRNEATPLVSEFIDRRRLAKLGFTSSFDELTAWKADAFIVIDVKLEELKLRDQERSLK